MAEAKEYRVAVTFEGTGSLKVRAESAAQAQEDAQQFGIEDVEYDSYSIKALDVREVKQP